MLEIGKTGWAAVDKKNPEQILETAESDLISDNLDVLKMELEAWDAMLPDYEIKKIRIVLIEDKD